jgi:O-glycosyl hydrolase
MEKGDELDLVMRMRRLISLLLAFILAFPLWPAPVGTKAAEIDAGADIVVDMAKEYQEIRGFGGMNYVPWIGDLTPAQRETAFGNGEGQLGFTILRIPIDPVKENWKLEVETARSAIEHGAIVFASPWNPPDYMTETTTIGMSTGNGSTYQEDAGVTLQGSVTENVYGGYTGPGYIRFMDEDGAYAQWNNVVIGITGTKNIAIRYALESSDAAAVDVYLNGSLALENVKFEPTGGWNKWAEKSIQLYMTPGGDNKVRFVPKEGTKPLIDRIIVTGYTEVQNGKRLRHDMYQEYADYLNEFIDFMKENGVDLYAISIQNEPDYAHDWTWWTPEEIVRFLKEYGGQIKTRVIAPESFQYVKRMSDPILEDDQALANLDILGAHLYGTQFSDFPYPLFKEKGAGKELWMTEVYYPNSNQNSQDLWPEALEVARHIHHALVDAEFQAYVWWYIRRHYGPMREDGTISKRGYMMAHYSKFVRPGYVRVDAAQTSPNPDILVSAYKDDDSKAVIVAINRGTTPVKQTVTVRNGAGPVGTVASWITDGGRDMVFGPPIDPVDHSFTAELPARSVTTFVVDLGDITAEDIANRITGIASPARGETGLTLPAVPHGFQIEIKDSDREDVIQKDGTIIPPISDTIVNLTLTVTRLKDGTTYDKTLPVLIYGLGMREEVRVDLEAEKQTMRGFGALNDPADDLTPEQRRIAFGTDDDQLGLSMLRIPVDPDPAKWEDSVETAREAVENGAIVFASPWLAPSDMVETFARGVPIGGTVYEAEERATLNNYVKDNTHSGFTGSGYVAISTSDPSATASVQWTGIVIGIEGTKMVTVRYALPEGVSYMNVYLNGELVESKVPFEATGGWSEWREVTLLIPMKVGNNNAIMLETTGSGGPNFDKITLYAYSEDVNARRLKHDKYEDYAAHLNEFYQYMKEQGVDLYAVSIQHEPDRGDNGLWWTAKEIVDFLKQHAGSVETRIIAPESFQYDRKFTDPILNDPEALANVDIVGTHLHGTPYDSFPYPLFEQKGKDKELWMTEYVYPEPADSWPKVLDAAKHIHHALADGQFQAYVWGRLTGNNGLIGQDGAISKLGHALAHYARFIRPGYVRVDAPSNPDEQVYVSAFKGEDRVVIVAVNAGDLALLGNFAVQSEVKSVESWITDAARNMAEGEPIAFANGAFQAWLPAQSVTTFVVHLPQYYELTLVAETGGSITAGSSGKYEAGTVIDIAASPSANYRFKEWTSSNGGTFADPKSASTSFTMPATDTTVKAVFEYVPMFPIPDPTLPIISIRDGVSQITVREAQLERTFQTSDTAVVEIRDSAGVTAYSAVLPARFVSADDDGRQIKIVSEIGTLTIPTHMFDAETLEDARQVAITIARADISSLDRELQQRIGDRPVLELSVTVDGSPVEWNNPEAPVTVTIPYTPTEEELADPEHIVVWYIDGQGNVVAVPSGKYDPATGTVTFTTTHFSLYAVAYVKKSFDDIAAYPWAVRAIEVLASKGVIDRAGSTFAPAEKTTRGEFILQLIRTLDLHAEAEDNFADIPADAPYAGAVAVAKKLGITNGVGGGRFDPEAPITRQDMMTLIVRALQVARIDLSLGTSKDLDRFIDKGDVADYAVQSVATLVKHGIVQGDGLRLNPTSLTTNAETAVLMYRLYRLAHG